VVADFGLLQLVDETFAKTNAPLEEISGIRADHGSICHIQRGGSEVSQITSFINNRVKQAWATLKTRSNAGKEQKV
jgi:hypothetical protein